MNINNLFNKIGNKVNNFIDNKKKQYQEYNDLINNSLVFELNNTFNNSNNNLNEGNIKQYSDICVYIKNNEAKTINDNLELGEIVIDIIYAIEKKDQQNYFIALTNLRILVINDNKYKTYNYSDITKFYVINKGIMSQLINFNDIILEVDINQTELNIFYNLIFNQEYRKSIINEKTKYLCGIIPIYQRINKIYSGISIDSNNNIVFHDRYLNNYKVNYNELLNYELMEDNTPVLKRKTREQSQAIGNTKKECYKMSIRITLNNNQVFEITILEPSNFNNSYNHMDKTYIECYNFGKEIIDKLEEFNKDRYI